MGRERLRVPMAEELVWARVMRPRVPLVYLDMNHLIGLAKVKTGHRAATQEYRTLYDSAMRAAAGRRAMFPIGGAHVWEIWKIRDPKQRAHLVEVLEDLTGFQYMLDRPLLAQLELEAGLARVNGEQGNVLGFPLLRQTIGQVFGLKGGLRFVNEHSEDVGSELRATMGDLQYDAMAARLGLEFQRHILRGPTDQEVEMLRLGQGYRPEVVWESHLSRVEFERETARLLRENPRWLHGRLRDLIAGRELVHEWLDLFSVRSADGKEWTLQPQLEGDQLLTVLGCMPHVQVAISLKTARHRNPALGWTPNDVTDIDALSVAYPYCDAVITDKAARRSLLECPELRALKRFLPTGPEELAEWLDALPWVSMPEMLVLSGSAPAPSRATP